MCIFVAYFRGAYALEDEGLSEVFFAGELSFVFVSDLSGFDSLTDSDSDFSLLVVFPA